MNPIRMENVLNDVPPLRFWGKDAVGWCCLAGAVTRYLEYIGDPVTYEEVMGVSGAAWRLIWDTGNWSPDNLIMAWYGHLLAEKRIAKAFGYEYAYIDRRRDTPRTGANSEETITARIRAEIDAGRPVIAIGIAGPEECLIAGYREGGKVLLVQSFFEQAGDGYLEVRDWYDQDWFLGLHLFTKTGERSSKRQNLIESLTRAVHMSALTEAGGRAAGLAAYNAWANDMLRDEEFDGLDEKKLAYNCMSIGDNGIILLCARKVAGDYLLLMQDEISSQAQNHLCAAAELHHKESETMGAAHDDMPWGAGRQGEELFRRTAHDNRVKLAQVIHQCTNYFEQAIDEIRSALEEEGVKV